ncbi:AAA domain-containing protein [Treponema putidum]
MFDLYEKSQINKKVYDMTKNYIEKLELKYNIILHGAPGTGKTFMARQIAAQMMFNKAYENLTDDEKTQIGFVQFHPSYDYTDFVEGLRPQKGSGQKEIGFERKNGVFKDFCEKAILAKNELGTDNFEKSWKELIDKLNNDVRMKIPLVSGKGSFEVELNEYGDGLATRTYNSEEDKKVGNWIRGQSKFFSKEQLYNIYKGLNGIPSGGHDNYRKAIVVEMKKRFRLEDYKKGKAKKNAPKFVFIIDEINRGDMSKIFGELFFSVDPDYRGINGKVLTQYQNLIENGDIFKNGFYIPDNVYIIGTMNDIDRSVESMDFAMRRRFVFYEITAEDSAKAMGIDYSVASPMKRLNDDIDEKLGSDYQIGGAYFKGYKDKLNDAAALKELWENNLKGLLREYLRGQRDAKSKLEQFESLFYGINTDSGQQQQNS